MKVVVGILLIANVALLLWGMGQREFINDEYAPSPEFHPELMQLLPPDKPKALARVIINEPGLSSATENDQLAATINEGPARVVINAGEGEPAVNVVSQNDGPASTPQTVQQGDCLFIGPYLTALSRGRAGRQLQDMDISFAETQQDKGRLLGYRVFQGPFDTSVETNRAKRRLEKQGVKDLYLISEGDKNYISLGFFSSSEAAAEFIKAFSRKQITTQQRTEHETYYWLNVSDAGHINKLRQKNTMPLPKGISKSIRPCPGTD
jgi:hypothetical protein